MNFPSTSTGSDNVLFSNSTVASKASRHDVGFILLLQLLQCTISAPGKILTFLWQRVLEHAL